MTENNEIYEIKISKVEEHKWICDSLNTIYEAKNKDYGDSFTKAYEKYGNVSILLRMFDKFSRLEQLLLNGDRQVADEKVTDTLLDMANYSIMAIMELERKNVSSL